MSCFKELKSKMEIDWNKAKMFLKEKDVQELKNILKEQKEVMKMPIEERKKDLLQFVKNN